MIKFTECPRDAMQGIKTMIPTEEKARYLNQLLKVGFDVLDFGSFVSPKAIPQMRDTADVLKQLDLSSDTQLLVIIANERGAEEASEFQEISFLGFPFSVSEEFQVRNTRSTRIESLSRVRNIQEIATRNDKKLLVYLSMGFGNPYKEDWSSEIVLEWTDKLYGLGVRDFALSDTIGSSNPAIIKELFPRLVSAYEDANWGMHLHTTAESWKGKIEAAYEAGCRRFDGAIKGYGGCPMAKDDLTGNMPSEKMISLLAAKEPLKINKQELEHSVELAQSIFP